MTRTALRLLALVAALTILAGLIAGCGDYGPTLPAPDDEQPPYPYPEGAASQLPALDGAMWAGAMVGADLSAG